MASGMPALTTRRRRAGMRLLVSPLFERSETVPRAAVVAPTSTGYQVRECRQRCQRRMRLSRTSGSDLPRSVSSKSSVFQHQPSLVSPGPVSAGEQLC